MESVMEMKIDIFGENLHGVDEIEKFSKLVHSSEKNQIKF